MVKVREKEREKNETSSQRNKISYRRGSYLDNLPILFPLRQLFLFRVKVNMSLIDRSMALFNRSRGDSVKAELLVLSHTGQVDANEIWVENILNNAKRKISISQPSPVMNRWRLLHKNKSIILVI